MRSDLQHIHDELLAGIAALERLCQADTPDRAELAQARWRLSQASGRRTRLVEAICAALGADASPAEAARLREVRERLAAARSGSTAHVGQWTLDRAVADWPGYRAASEQMRAAMRRQIADEVALLYPLLERRP